MVRRLHKLDTLSDDEGTDPPDAKKGKEVSSTVQHFHLRSREKWIAISRASDLGHRPIIGIPSLWQLYFFHSMVNLQEHEKKVSILCGYTDVSGGWFLIRSIFEALFSHLSCFLCKLICTSFKFIFFSCKHISAVFRSALSLAQVHWSYWLFDRLASCASSPSFFRCSVPSSLSKLIQYYLFVVTYRHARSRDALLIHRSFSRRMFFFVQFGNLFSQLR